MLYLPGIVKAAPQKQVLLHLEMVDKLTTGPAGQATEKVARNSGHRRRDEVILDSDTSV